jgi:hypothetical protein
VKTCTRRLLDSLI